MEGKDLKPKYHICASKGCQKRVPSNDNIWNLCQEHLEKLGQEMYERGERDRAAYKRQCQLAREELK